MSTSECMEGCIPNHGVIGQGSEFTAPLQDDTWRPALGDLLHTDAFTGLVNGIHHIVFIWKSTGFQFREDQLFIDLDFKASLPPNEARNVRFRKLLQDHPLELLIAGAVASSATVLDFDLDAHRFA